MESRQFENKPPLRQVLDFVIVDNALHEQFEEFRSTKLPDRDYCILETNNLLEFWNECERATSQPPIILYGKKHYKLHYKEMDKLCEWVMKEREKVVRLICCLQ